LVAAWERRSEETPGGPVCGCLPQELPHGAPADTNRARRERIRNLQAPASATLSESRRLSKRKCEPNDEPVMFHGSEARSRGLHPGDRASERERERESKSSFQCRRMSIAPAFSAFATPVWLKLAFLRAGAGVVHTARRRERACCHAVRGPTAALTYSLVLPPGVAVAGVACSVPTHRAGVGAPGLPLGSFSEAC
jgi:hypothetical protein